MEDKDVLIIDAETTAFKRLSTNQYDPSPFLPHNKLVRYGGLRLRDSAAPTIWSMTDGVELSPFKMLVGHNIKFDLLWSRRAKTTVRDLDTSSKQYLWDYIAQHATVWDTQLAEYLCSGQTMLFPSLEECCVKRGITLRKSINLKEEIPKVNGDVSLIPDLDKYLKNDLEMTRELFLMQMADPHVVAHLDWYMAQMDALLGETEIEWNGMAVDYGTLMHKANDGMRRCSTIEADIKAILLANSYTEALVEQIELTKPSHLSALLYGGELKWEEREEIGKYKTGAKIGQARFRVHKKAETLKSLTHIKVITDAGELSTSDEALEQIINSGSGLGTTIAKATQLHRSLNKSVGTTLEGLLKWSVVNATTGEHHVHPQLNGCQTVTGRRSSSKPNGQNFPTDDPLKCKEVLGPRTLGRAIVSIDFKQAEVMALAYVANDTVLMKDITDGVDIHNKMGRNVYGGRDLTKEERRVVKTVVFGTIYGGQAETLAAQAKVGQKIVEKILREFSSLYPRSWAYLQEVVIAAQTQLDTHPIPTEEIVQTPRGAMRVPICIMESSTGRRYSFKGYWRNFRSRFGVSTTQPKNYFIQGFATGDLVPICVGRVWRWMEHHYPLGVEMIGTIHDSLIFEVDREMLDRFIKDVVVLINDAGIHLASVCPNMKPWTMPVNCDVEVGTNLGDLKAYG